MQKSFATQTSTNFVLENKILREHGIFIKPSFLCLVSKLFCRHLESEESFPFLCVVCNATGTTHDKLYHLCAMRINIVRLFIVYITWSCISADTLFHKKLI
jgi:hypothetical protein